MQTDEEVMAAWIRSRYPEPRSIRERVAAARTRGALATGAAYLVVFVTLQVLTPHGSRRRRWATGQPHWLDLTAAGLLVLGSVLVVAATAYALTTGRARASRQSPLVALTVRQRRQVRRQALGQQPSSAADLTFLRVVAARLSKADYVTALAAGALLLFSGLTILSAQPLRTLNAVLAAFQAVALVVLLRRPVLARAFLKEHPPLLEQAGR